MQINTNSEQGKAERQAVCGDYLFSRNSGRTKLKIPKKHGTMIDTIDALPDQNNQEQMWRACKGITAIASETAHPLNRELGALPSVQQEGNDLT